MINILVKHTVDINLSGAFETISNFQNYVNWWSISVKTIDIKSGYFEFKPLFFVVVGINVIPGKHELVVQYNYTKGPFRGYGIWKFNELKNNKTQISYEVFLHPINLIYSIASSTKIFRAKHEKDIKNIIVRIKPIK